MCQSSLYLQVYYAGSSNLLGMRTVLELRERFAWKVTFRHLVICHGVCSFPDVINHARPGNWHGHRLYRFMSTSW